MIRRSSAVLLMLIGSGCASPVVVQSTAAPGVGIVTFANTEDREHSTVIYSQAYAQVAGVNGRTLTVGDRDRNSADLRALFAIDQNGNVGIRGSLSSTSSRALKTDIRPYTGDPLATLRTARVVNFRYIGENASAPRHVGFIAEEAPTPLADPAHRSINIDNAVAIDTSAIQRLDADVARLTARVRRLESALSQVRERERSRTGSR